ncbi:MAG: [LysW]-aminoadipate kinase [Phycisphaerales bacterium]|nr:[LysW]-aminoadipate kinase [Phycisphaerales bacterium]
MQDVITIKIGGGKGVDLDRCTRDLAALHQAGRRFVLVHGGSHETNVLSERLGHPPTTITSPSGHTSRRTDRTTLEIFEMAYCGKVNKGIVEQLQSLGVNAVGLSGLDGRLWTGERKKAIRSVEDGRVRVIRDDLTGKVHTVNASLLHMLLDAGYTPVVTPPAISDEHEAINVDADRAAALTAGALESSCLMLLSNVAGLLRAFPDEDSLIRRVERGHAEAAQEFAEGRMKNKVLAACEALERGVERVVIGDARRERPIHDALEGVGTVFA